MRDLFTKDLGWKLFSLFLATAVWLTANRILNEKGAPDTNSSTRTATYDELPVTLVSTAADVHDFHFAPTSVKVTVTGPADVMGKLQADHLRATANVTGVALTHGQLVDVEVYAPPQVAVVSIEPEKVMVTPPPPKN
jgi:YbbR domain-containing protein